MGDHDEMGVFRAEFEDYFVLQDRNKKYKGAVLIRLKAV